MSIKLSRGPSINLEQCVEMSGGDRFNLVLMASIRSREISRQHKNSENREHIYPNVSALLEFQEGKIGPEYIKKVR
jgi:DNA-directed RNA polymerase subunit K/omega